MTVTLVEITADTVRAVHADGELGGFVMLADETLRLVLERVRSRPGVRKFATSYVPAPDGPGPFYLGLGFTPTGEIDDGEIVLAYPRLHETEG